MSIQGGNGGVVGGNHGVGETGPDRGSRIEQRLSVEKLDRGECCTNLGIEESLRINRLLLSPRRHFFNGALLRLKFLREFRVFLSDKIELVGNFFPNAVFQQRQY